MQSYTTKSATELLYNDDFRSNGCAHVWCLQNESGTIELEATTEEVQSALVELQLDIDSDVVSDGVMSALVEHLNSTRALDVPVS